MLLRKACNRCGEMKPATADFFVPNKKCRNGITGTCRSCILASGREWKARNRDRLCSKRRADYAERYGEINRQNELERRRLKPLQCRAAMLASGLRTRSKENGWPLPDEFRAKKYFVDWLVRQPNCECCGVEFRIELTPEQPLMPSARSPSLDRFNTAEPYTIENTALVCWRCNNIKRDYSSMDLQRVADWIDQRGGGVLPQDSRLPVSNVLRSMQDFVVGALSEAA